MLLSNFSNAFGMNEVIPSPEAEKVFRHCSPVSQSPIIQAMQIPQRRASLPDRRQISLLALRDFHMHQASPDNTSSVLPKSVASIGSLQASPVGTPHTNRSTPSGVGLHNFVDRIFVTTLDREATLQDGWKEKKKRAFKADDFSKTSNEDDIPLEAGTIVYHVHSTNKLYKVVGFSIQEAIFKTSVVVDARGDAIEELRIHLTKEVEKEAKDNGWTLENSTKE